MKTSPPQLLLLLLLLLFLFVFRRVRGTTTTTMSWCVVSDEEESKCRELSSRLRAAEADFGGDYVHVLCVRGVDEEDCMTLVDEEKADVTSVDAGFVYRASRFHSLVPILQEVPQRERAVALVKKDSLPDVRRLSDLRGKKACFAGVGTLAGWFLPIHTLMRRGGMSVADCNNHVKTASEFFGDSCAVNSLSNAYNPAGDNSDKLCRICGGGTGRGERCTARDPYGGYAGAVRCLLDRGDVAFVSDRVAVDADRLRPDSFRLLCPDGSRRSIDDRERCDWGRVPSDAIITTTAKSPEERSAYQRFLKRAAEVIKDVDPLLGAGGELIALEGSRQMYSEFLQENLQRILDVHDCPIASMTLCVTSDIEMDKCFKMKTALNAQMLKPAVNCFRADSQVKCMEAIANRFADVAVFDAGDVHDAGKNHGLVPILSEVYDLGKPEYHVVAVARKDDPSTDLTYLKDKHTCHAGVNTAAGWTVPLAALLTGGHIRSYPCDPMRTASEYFSKSCVPGALAREYSADARHRNLCDLCHSTTFRFCRRDPSEAFFGTTGAFRCLVEGGGDVAFVKHTTVFESTDGKRRDIWSRNTFSDDYELLCLDGKRSGVGGYASCSLGRVKSNAVVARSGNDTEIRAFVDLFAYAQQHYGRKSEDPLGFGLFASPAPHYDVIFQDATTRLRAVPKPERNYATYLGRDFLRAKRIVDC